MVRRYEEVVLVCTVAFSVVRLRMRYLPPLLLLPLILWLCDIVYVCLGKVTIGRKASMLHQGETRGMFTVEIGTIHDLIETLLLFLLQGYCSPGLATTSSAWLGRWMVAVENWDNKEEEEGDPTVTTHETKKNNRWIMDGILR
jgi:hypothetical protein